MGDFGERLRSLVGSIGRRTARTPGAELRKATDAVTANRDTDLARRLSLIRSSELPDATRDTLHAIGEKANEQGLYPDNALTWRDLYDTGLAVWSVDPHTPDQRPPYWDTAEQFTFSMSQPPPGETISPDAPVPALSHQEVFLRGMKLVAQGEGGGIRMHLVTDADAPGAADVTQAVYGKLRRAGLPVSMPAVRTDE